MRLKLIDEQKDLFDMIGHKIVHVEQNQQNHPIDSVTKEDGTITLWLEDGSAIEFDSFSNNDDTTSIIYKWTVRPKFPRIDSG